MNKANESTPDRVLGNSAGDVWAHNYFFKRVWNSGGLELQGIMPNKEELEPV